jgi:hypothetical protein
MSQSLSNKSATFILLSIAILLMPVAAVVSGATQWVLIAGSLVMLLLCAYNIGINNRR